MSYSKILVPVAPAHGDEALRAVQVARSLVATGGTITVITVLEDVPRYVTMEAYVMDPVIEAGQQAVRKAVVEQFTAPDIEVVVRQGYPTRVILDEARGGGYDCIVIPSAQPGWEHFFLGSTASSVVRHAHCSVHVVRHEEGRPRSA